MSVPDREMIKRGRAELGWTQEVFAGISKYDVRTIQNVESGRTKKPQTVRDLKDTLNKHLAERKLPFLDELCSIPEEAEAPVVDRVRRIENIAAQIALSTDEIDLVGGKVRLVPDDPKQRLFQPMQLLRELSEEEQNGLIAQLRRRPTATEMGSFDGTTVERRAREFVRDPSGRRRTSETGEEDLAPEPGLDSKESVEEEVPVDRLFEAGADALGRAARVILLGAPGGGKSVAMRYFAQQFATGRMTYLGRRLLPLPIRLSSWCNFATTHDRAHLEDFAADLYPDLGRDEWLEELKAGRVVLLLDGLDEVNDPEDRFISSGLNRALTQHPKCPSAIACRTFAFPIYRPMFRDASVYQLGHVSPAQILAYCDAYAEIVGISNVRLEERMRRVLQTSSMAVLAGNPLLLSVICFVLGHRESAPLLAVRTQLFNDAVSLLLERPRPMAPTLDRRLREMRRPVLETGSLELFERQMGQSKAVVLNAALVHPSFQDAAKAHGFSPADGLEVLRDAIERGLIMQHRTAPYDKGVFNYLHLQFHEYLAACGLLADPDFVQLVFNRLSSPRWREVILLAIGQLAMTDSPDDGKFLQTVRGLLGYQDAFARFLPRAALLLVSAIPDLSVLPREMIDQISREIIESYADRRRLQNFPDLARQLEQAFGRLAALDQGERVLPILLQCLVGIDAERDRGMAAASLIRTTRLFTTDIVLRLVSCYPEDRAEWDWPIDAALREIASDPEVGDLLDSSVPFRLLKDDPEGWTRFSEDAGWQWIAVVLMGGLDAGKETRLKLARIEAAEARRLHEVENAKSEVDQAERDLLSQKKQAAEDRVKEIESSLHHLSPGHFHRPGPLNARLWRAFENQQRSGDVIEEIFRSLDDSTEELERTDILLMVALAVPATALLPLIRQPERFAQALTRLDAALRVSVEPALNEALGSAKENRPAIFSLLEEGRHGKLISAVARATWRYTSTHPFTLDAARETSDTQLKASRLAEFLHRSFLSESEDRIYNWCVSLDTVGKQLGGDPDVLATALATAHHAGNAKPWRAGGWSLDALAPRLDGSNLPAQLGQALDALAAIPYSLDFVRGWALVCLAPKLREAGMLEEATMMAWTTLSDRFRARTDALDALLVGREARVVEGANSRWKRGDLGLGESKNSYVRARLLLAERHILLVYGRLPPHGPVLTEIRRVKDPVLRGWLLEALHRLVLPADAAAVLREAKEAASVASWRDADNRTRAILRLSAFETLAADAVIEDHLVDLKQQLARKKIRFATLAEALATLRPYVQGNAELQQTWESAYEMLPEDHLRLEAQGLAVAELQQAVIRAPGPATILGAAAVVLDFRQVLQIPDDVDGIWLSVSGESRESALRKLGEAAKPPGLHLTRIGALALSRLMHKNDWPAIRQILPLLRGVDLTALPLITELGDHHDSVIAHHAQLIRAEAIGLCDETFPALVKLLECNDYFIRARAALALHGDQSDDEGPLSASFLGRTVLEALADRRNYDRDLRTGLIMGWTMERVVFDDPAMIADWIAVAHGEDDAAESAQRVLAQVEKITSGVWSVLIGQLQIAPPKARRAILRSLCGQANLGGVHGTARTQLCEALTRVDLTGEADIAYMHDGPGVIVTVVFQLLDEGADDRGHDRRTIARMCRERFFERQKLLSGVKLEDPAKWVEVLSDIGSQRKAGPRFTARLAEATRQLEKRPEAMRILVPWLLEELSGPEAKRVGREYFFLSGDLLGVLADAAERFPGEFRDIARAYPMLTDRISFASTRHGTFPGRQAAFRLMATLSNVDASVASAYYGSLRDVARVQSVAVLGLRLYKDIDPKFVAKLLNHLETARCPTEAYLTSQILAALAHNVFLPPEIRGEIVLGIQRALALGSLDRDVHLLEVGLSGTSQIFRLVNLGRLDRLLYQVLLDLSGVAL